MPDRGYDEDLVLWCESQGRALRDAAHAGTNLPIDWENVAEEIESLGKSQGRELASRIRIILVHLMKLQASPATEPRAGWRETIVEQRSEIEAVIEDSPSLRQTVDSVLAKELRLAKRQVVLSLADHGETARLELDRLSYSKEQVLGDWFPDQP
jgi:hypothetical protein